MLGDAKSVVNRAIASACIEARSGADVGGRHAGERLYLFRRIARLAYEGLPIGEIVWFTAFGDKVSVDQISRSR